jgi:uncharacterized membrane protein HdeD (DUF308 family)
MRAATLIGIILIILGVVALAFQGISYVRQEQVADLGPVDITAERRETIPLPPILGIAALAGGVVLVIVGSRRS